MLWSRSISIHLALTLLVAAPTRAQHLLVPMDERQSDHLKAYGLAYWCLQEPRVYRIEWLLNYACGAFLLPAGDDVLARARQMGVVTEPVSDAQLQQIRATIADSNEESVLLEKAPRVAVYIPPDKEPWDDAVTLALTYADIPYDKLWDAEILAGRLADYDWLHLHHEDFTGQHGKFWAAFRHEAWYRRTVQTAEKAAAQAGYPSVQAYKCAVAKAIREWVGNGGFLFAMCSATDTLDIALAAEGVDIVPPEIDGTPIDPNAQAKLDYSKTLAFKDFLLVEDAASNEFSDIDTSPPRDTMVSRGQTFKLFEFSAKQDPVLTMLTQDHTGVIHDFLGQTTAFRRSRLKDTVIVMGESADGQVAKYIHGDYGKGTFTFYGGHDPEDYAHIVGEAPTDLSFHTHSPGYRLILNNILFPAAKRQEKKT
jgi:hypothetical protein